MLALALAVLAGGLAACSRSPGHAANGPVTSEQLAALTLRVGAPNRIGNRPYLEVAGELAKTPYKIEWVEFSATPALLEALRNGDVDIGGNGGATGLIFEAGNNGTDAIKVVAAGRTVGNSPGAAALIVRKGARYRSLADLRGARISVLQGTGTQYILKRELERAGLAPRDVTFSSLSNDMAVAALISGHIDVLGIWEPQASVLLSRPDLQLLQWIGGNRDSYALQFASTDALADPVRRAAIQDFLTRLARSTVKVADQPQAFSSAMSRLARIDPAIALSITRKTGYRYGLDAAQQDQLKRSFADEIAFWRKDGVLHRDVPVDALFDFRFEPALRAASAGQ
ncbi:PhnD/SsuA/transferrin family substrate-binding protein [Novosphingobium sp. KCTC 2891]|nr:PhnD/SsuA/transferrin family substrate-binding protein [Novosphingobium sp. KCTC 2891]